MVWNIYALFLYKNTFFKFILQVDIINRPLNVCHRNLIKIDICTLLHVCSFVIFCNFCNVFYQMHLNWWLLFTCLWLCIKAHVHWWFFRAKMLATATHYSHYCTCLGNLGQHDTDVMFLLAKVSKEGAILHGLSG